MQEPRQLMSLGRLQSLYEGKKNIYILRGWRGNSPLVKVPIGKPAPRLYISACPKLAIRSGVSSEANYC